MAFGNGRKSDGSSFVRHEGIGIFEIAAVNPTAKELAELTGRDQENEIEYVTTDDDGIKTAKIVVYLNEMKREVTL